MVRELHMGLCGAVDDVLETVRGCITSVLVVHPCQPVFHLWSELLLPVLSLVVFAFVQERAKIDDGWKICTS